MSAGASNGEDYAEHVYRAVLRLIIEGSLAPGARLKERELSERFAVSRIPVRQALQRLESDGFIATERHRGAFVRSVRRGDIEELFDARLCIEPFAAERAARRVADGIERPDRLAELVEVGTSADPGVARTANLDFHAEIVRLSGNGLLVRSLAPMLGRMEWLFRLTQETRAREQTVEHRELFESIATGQGALAAAQAYAHIETGRRPVIEALADRIDEGLGG